MYRLFKPLLFRLDPEKAHNVTTKLFSGILRLPGARAVFKSAHSFEDEGLSVECLGLKFKNRVGLAAGFDKEARYIDAMDTIGFGFVEIGTVTPISQEGNPKPRLFRLKKDEAIINRMGFNNMGLEKTLENLRNRRSDILVGGNIGKNKITPNQSAKEDYLKCFNALYDYVDYFVVNVSSPNTPGLRDLQDRKPLTDILSVLISARKTKSDSKPILLKIAPDLTDGQRKDIAEMIEELDLDGLVSCNTTISRDDLNTGAQTLQNIGNGGLSGAPLFKQSLSQIIWFRKRLSDKRVIIGVGGINSPERAALMLESGADLIQIYSGMIYEGPSLIKKILKHIA